MAHSFMFELTPSQQSVYSLRTERNQPIPEVMYTPLGEPIHVRCDRIKGIARFSGHPPFEFRFDTGAYISILPYHVWRPAANQFQWMRGDQSSALVPTYSLGGLFGGSNQFRIGLVDLEFISTDPETLMATTMTRRIVAACEETPSLLKKTYLGMGGDVLKNGGGCIHYDERKAWHLDFSRSKPVTTIPLMVKNQPFKEVPGQVFSRFFSHFSIGAPYTQQNPEDAPVYPLLVDSGNPITLIREREWSAAEFRNRIFRWILPPSKAIPVQGMGNSGLTAGVAEIDVFLYGKDYQSRRTQVARRVLVRCARDRSLKMELPFSLLGTGGRALEGISVSLSDENSRFSVV